MNLLSINLALLLLIHAQLLGQSRIAGLTGDG